MSNSQITGGLVSVEDGLKKAEEYAPPRKVRVELTFSVAEGEGYETVFDAASNAASNRVQALLHGTPIAAVQTDTAAPSEQTPEPAKPAARRGRPPKAAAEAPPGPSPETVADPSQVTGDPSAVVDPGAAGTTDAAGSTSNEDPLTVQPDPSAVTEDVLSSGPAPEEVISDADLAHAATRRNDEISDPVAIRNLIGSYNPDPSKVFQIKQIPQEKRREFLDKLAALPKKPAAA